jgi:hypothetical protein
MRTTSATETQPYVGYEDDYYMVHGKLPPTASSKGWGYAAFVTGLIVMVAGGIVAESNHKLLPGLPIVGAGLVLALVGCCIIDSTPDYE